MTITLKDTVAPLYTIKDSIITFGSYPQSRVTDEGLLARLGGFDPETWVPYEHHYNKMTGDSTYRIDVTLDGCKYRGMYKKIGRTGESETAWFLYEPLKWLAYHQAYGETDLFLRCLSVIDGHRFYGTEEDDYRTVREIDGETVYCNNYMYSDVRAYVTGEVFETAFTEAERELVILHEVFNEAKRTNGYENDYWCKNTTDRIFLLSTAEAISNIRYVDRNLVGSDYACYMGGYHGWWLRSPSWARGDCAYTVANHDITSTGDNLCFNNHGIVPGIVMRIPEDLIIKVSLV